MKKIYFSHLLPGVTPGVLSHPQPGLIPDVFYAVGEYYDADAPDLDSFIQDQLAWLNEGDDNRWSSIDEGVTVACLPRVPFRIMRGIYPDTDIWVAFYAKD